MSLSVYAVQRLETGGTAPIEGAPRDYAGGERWRTDIWGSNAVISVAEAVRRPRPSRLILPSLAAQDIFVEGEELDQLEREVDALLAHAVDVVRKIQSTAPLFLEAFRDRLLTIKEAVQLARTVPRGGVVIS